MIRICMPVANSAGCERAFSLFGAVHTKYRNKLRAEQVHKIGVMKMDIWHQQIAKGLGSNRKKRKFQMEPELERSNLNSTSIDSTDFLRLGTSLINEAAADDKEPDLPPLPIPSPAPPEPSLRSRSGQSIPRKVLLAQFFNYDSAAAALNNRAGLDFYWKGGIRIVEEELQQLDNDEDLPQDNLSSVHSSYWSDNILGP